MNERIHDEPPPMARKHFPAWYRVRGWDGEPEPIFDTVIEDEEDARTVYESYVRGVNCGELTAAQISENGMILHRVSNAPRAPSTAAFLGQREEAE